VNSNDHGDVGTLHSITNGDPNSRNPKKRPQAQKRTQLSNMSRRAEIVEEFDDDTDLPLPSRLLPDTGSRGAILEKIVDLDVDEDDDDDADSDEAPELLDPSAGGSPASRPDARDGRVTDITPYKKCANLLITDMIYHWLTTHAPPSDMGLGGRVFIQFTLMRSDHMELVLGEYRDPRVCGGL
jgi:hypothetical protein